MLKKEDSNRILKGIKAVIFATSLSLINPVGIQANDNITQEISDVEYENDKKNLVETTIIITFITALGTIALYNYKLNKNSFHYNQVEFNNNDNNFAYEKEAINEIKIICK